MGGVMRSYMIGRSKIMWRSYEKLHEGLCDREGLCDGVELCHEEL